MLKYNSMKLFVVFIPMIALVDIIESDAAQCIPGKQILWYYSEPNLDAKIYNGFSSELFNDLSSPLSDLGYCLRIYEKDDTLHSSPTYSEDLLMRVVCKDMGEAHAPEDTNIQIELIVGLVTINNFEKGSYNVLPDRPLASLLFSHEDLGSIRTVFEKKIIENLRTQYICNLMITSDPSGVKVTSHSGLSDITPFEWVVPVGKLNIQCTLKDYFPYIKDINLNRPGVYNYFLQLKKRQWYHSKFFFPGVGCGFLSALCYYFDNFYYTRYKNLGKPDFENDPESFERTFTTAQTFERMSISFLALSCTFLGLSILF
jgi:hypothetical protein